jgi:ubiquinone/menaquinone biosynthesis C-methylase UbiE
VQGDATQMPFANEQFQALYAFHLLMHLEPAQVEQMLHEAHRVLQPGGLLIVDFPSRARRALTRGHHNANWHGSTAFEVDEWRKQYANKWQWVEYQGVLWLPVHRIPKRLRSLFASLDDLLCRSFLKKYASYHIVALRKHDAPY